VNTLGGTVSLTTDSGSLSDDSSHSSVSIGTESVSSDEASISSPDEHSSISPTMILDSLSVNSGEDSVGEVSIENVGTSVALTGDSATSINSLKEKPEHD
jgi:hypothetical protein